MVRLQVQAPSPVMVLEVREELIANRLLAILRVCAPWPDENHRALRTEAAKVTLLLNPSQGWLRHGVSQNDRFQIHDWFEEGRCSGALHVLPLLSAVFANALIVFVYGKFGAKRRK